jgi:hypothetical protein
MKIDIDDIKASPTELDYVEEVEDANERLRRGAGSTASAAGWTCTWRTTKSGLDIFFDGTVRGSVRATCARCLSEYDLPLDDRFSLVLAPRSADVTKARLTDDLELSTYEGDEIDLAPLVHERGHPGPAHHSTLHRRLPWTLSRCGADLNAGPCGCRRRPPIRGLRRCAPCRAARESRRKRRPSWPFPSAAPRRANATSAARTTRSPPRTSSPARSAASRRSVTARAPTAARIAGARSSRRPRVEIPAPVAVCLLPGQGSQRVGMGRDLADSFPVARRVFEEADDRLGLALSRLCFEGPEDVLVMTEHAQPAILAASVAAFRVLEETAGLRPSPSRAQPRRVVGARRRRRARAGGRRGRRARRGRLMQEAVPAGEGGWRRSWAPSAEVERLCDGCARERCCRRPT